MFWIGGIGLDLEVDEMHRPVYFPPVSGTRTSRDLGAGKNIYSYVEKGQRSSRDFLISRSQMNLLSF